MSKIFIYTGDKSTQKYLECNNLTSLIFNQGIKLFHLQQFKNVSALIING